MYASQPKSTVGTVAYIAPEVLTSKRDSAKYKVRAPLRMPPLPPRKRGARRQTPSRPLLPVWQPSRPLLPVWHRCAKAAAHRLSIDPGGKLAGVC